MQTEPSSETGAAEHARIMAKRGREKLAGLVILAVSLSAFISSLLMERMGTGIDRILGAPGLTPGFLSVILVILSAVLILRNRDVPFDWPRLDLDETQKRMVGAFALILAYILSLYWLPYALSTFAMMAVFQFAFASRKRSVAYVLIWCLGYSAVISGLLYYVFGEVFYIPLP